jgi:hypothetical protein
MKLWPIRPLSVALFWIPFLAQTRRPCPDLLHRRMRLLFPTQRSHCSPPFHPRWAVAPSIVRHATSRDDDLLPPHSFDCLLQSQWSIYYSLRAPGTLEDMPNGRVDCTEQSADREQYFQVTVRAIHPCTNNLPMCHLICCYRLPEVSRY